MSFKFTFDKELCIQCGICGDSCPVNALDFTRPRHNNVEDDEGKADLSSDMTEYPIQVNKCIGCQICPEECPVSCIDIIETQAEPDYYPKQGPMMTDEPDKDAFGLTRFTKIRPTRMKSKDQWGNAFMYRPRRRKFQTQAWESMAPEAPPIEAPIAQSTAMQAPQNTKASTPAPQVHAAAPVGPAVQPNPVEKAPEQHSQSRPDVQHVDKNKEVKNKGGYAIPKV